MTPLHRSTLRLAALNSALILALFGVVAILIYQYTVQTFDYDVSSQSADSGGAAVEAGFARLRTALITGMAFLMIVVPFVSYGIARRALRPVRLAYEAQSRFVDDASHEFRNPLASIQASGELALLKTRQPREYEATLRDILRDVEALGQLTRGLLMLTRSDRRSYAAAAVDVSVTTIADEARVSFPPGMLLSFEVEPGLRVNGVPSLLRSALTNLVDNATKFGGSAVVRISARQSKGSVIIEVADLGAGMTVVERQHAFDRFWRADAARSHAGHGLGLSLVRHIATLHGGSVSLRANVPHGTIARLTLPMSGVSR